VDSEKLVNNPADDDRVAGLTAGGRGLGRRQVWPFFSTPLRVFVLVMGPIAGSMTLLAALPGVPAVIRITAGVVVAASLYGLVRGYANRVEADAEGIRYRGPGKHFRIPWRDVRHLDRYTPLDRNRTTQYVYATRLEVPPADWREIDRNTVQLQDRPGLLESLRAYWLAAQHEEANRSGPQEVAEAGSLRASEGLHHASLRPRPSGSSGRGDGADDGRGEREPS
jgi:hypothetical protein